MFAYVGMVEAEGPDAQRWVDLMHSLWLDRSPALAFMAEYAGQERDWEHLARQALPGLPADVFEARFGLAIETIIVGLRTPSPRPARSGEAPWHAARPGRDCSSTSSPPHWKGNADVTGAHRGARAGDPPRHHEPPRAAQRPEPGVDRRAARRRSSASTPTATVRAVILTGAGRGFCSGDDLKGVEGEHGAPGTEGMGQIPLILLTQEHLASLHERIHRLRQPVIAAVNGAAVGGGFAMALSCDVRFAAESARFGSVFVTLGVSSCDMGTSYLLPRLVGACRVLPSSCSLAASSTRTRHGRWTSCSTSSPTAPSSTARWTTARQIVANAPLAVWMTKETMWQTIDAPSFRHALDMENRTQVMCTQTGELSAAAEAFREGRAPEWRPL